MFHDFALHPLCVWMGAHLKLSLVIHYGCIDGYTGTLSLEADVPRTCVYLFMCTNILRVSVFRFLSLLDPRSPVK